MQLDDVVVYWTSCITSMSIGSKKPHYIIDLLFREDTIPAVTEPQICGTPSLTHSSRNTKRRVLGVECEVIGLPISQSFLPNT